MCSVEKADPLLSDAGKTELLEIAITSIKHGLEQERPLPLDPNDYSEELQVERACFVTLHREGNLRGCIGSLEATQPLVADVAENAFSAAFRDPRFDRLTKTELTGLEIHISVLTPSTPMRFNSEAELLRQIRPGIDGLILTEGSRRGTFLPSVWDALPEPTTFLQQLKRKAGLPGDYWSEKIEIARYQTLSFP
ncbi:MAG: AmmeMemoRadiSam system protein A [Chromatiales bacterium]|nr:AmmeMemoRadiSam system protein A [Chromatiales bacterium]